MSKLRLEDAEAWAAVTGNAVKVEMLLALIALARAAKREVACSCGAAAGSPSVLHAPDCTVFYCPDTAAELERWE